MWLSGDREAGIIPRMMMLSTVSSHSSYLCCDDVNMITVGYSESRVTVAYAVWSN